MFVFWWSKTGIQGYTNANMAGDIDSKKFTLGYLVTLVGRTFLWQSKLQECVALSTTEVEYIAVIECCKEILWMKRFFSEIGF